MEVQSAIMSLRQTRFQFVQMILAAAFLVACSPNASVVDCYEAASSNKTAAYCRVTGTLLQTGIGFAVRPEGHSPSTHSLLILVQDGNNFPSVSGLFEIGKFDYCGPYYTDGGFTYIELPFNSDGTYSGDYIITECNDAS